MMTNETSTAMEIVATRVNGTAVVDSRLIAQSIGIEHNALMQNVRNHQTLIEKDFGGLTFEMLNRANVRPEKI